VAVLRGDEGLWLHDRDFKAKWYLGICDIQSQDLGGSRASLEKRYLIRYESCLATTTTACLALHPPP
jgi:hypothetical protein